MIPSNYEIESLRNIAIVLAHSVVYESGPDYGVVCADPKAPDYADQYKDMVEVTLRQTPALMKLYGEQILPYEQANLDAQKVLQPQQQQLNYDVYKQFGPLLNQVGADIARQNAVAQSATELDLLKGTGGQTVTVADELLRKINPEYYANRAATSDSYTKLLGSLDPTKLTGGEAAATERANNANIVNSGNVGSGSRSATLGAALKFDDRLTAKKNQLNQVLSNFGGIQTGSMTNIDPFKVAVGRGSTPDYAGDKFTGTMNLGNTATQVGQAGMGQMGSMWNNMTQINAQRRDALDRGMEVANTVANMAGAAK